MIRNLLHDKGYIITCFVLVIGYVVCKTMIFQ